MKKIFLLIAICFFSCSKDHVSENIDYSYLNSDWKFTGGVFTGNNNNGVVDTFFNNTLLKIHSNSDFNNNYYIYITTYPNGARGNLSLLVRDGIFNASNLIDEGVKRSNSITTYYDGKENLIDYNSNNILLNKSGSEQYDITFSNNTMVWTKDIDGYTITYNFIKD